MSFQYSACMAAGIRSPASKRTVLAETIDLAMLFEIASDRKSTRLNSSHSQISYAVFCLKKKSLVVLTPRTPTTRVQPEGCMPRADGGRAQAALTVELPQSREGLRRPDDASAHPCRGIAPAAPREGIGVPRAGAGDRQGRDGGVVSYGVVRGGGSDLVCHARAGHLFCLGAGAEGPVRVVPGHAREAWDQRAAPRPGWLAQGHPGAPRQRD